MDAPTPVSPNPNPSVEASQGLINRIKNSSKRTKMIALGVVAVIALAILSYFLLNQARSQETIATVGDTKIPRAYLDIELEYYPSTPSAEVNQFLTQKIVDDQVTLLAGREAGIISSFPEGANVSNEEYLQRTGLVEQVRDEVNKKSEGIEVEVVSVWFFNGTFAPIGYQEGRQKALSIITDLHKRVKAGEITMKQAGEEIAGDASLAGLDKSYKENAYTIIKRKSGQALTFWKPYDDMLWKLEQGEVSQIYTGTETDTNDRLLPALYTFGKLTDKITDTTALNYDDWLAEQKKNYETSY